MADASVANRDPNLSAAHQVQVDRSIGRRQPHPEGRRYPGPASRCRAVVTSSGRPPSGDANPRWGVCCPSSVLLAALTCGGPRQPDPVSHWQLGRGWLPRPRPAGHRLLVGRLPKSRYACPTATNSAGVLAQTPSSAACSSFRQVEAAATGTATTTRAGCWRRIAATAAHMVAPVARPSSTTITTLPVSAGGGRWPR
jgi:hypothetical protein